MSLLITEPRVGIMEMNERDGTARPLPFQMLWPCMPCAGPSLIAFACAQTQECLLVKRKGWEVISRMPSVTGLSAMCLSPCERYVYQLSCEADCIHTLCAATGELMYAAPIGVFPRMMQLDKTGNHLLSAGGAEAQAFILRAPDLHCEKVIHTPHPCFAAAFWQNGLVLVCAAEGNDIQTLVYTLGPKALRPQKKAELPGQPGGLCVCPDGRHILLSLPDGLMKLSLDTGEILWNRPQWPLCMKICCKDHMALLSDTLDGKACLMDHRYPWQQRIMGAGFGVQACFLS